MPKGNELSVTDQEVTSKQEFEFSTITNVIALIFFIGSSFLVFNVGGYNNFIPTDLILLSRISVVCVLLLSTLILYRTEGKWNKFWRLSYAFLVASIGLLLAWIFGRWYQLIPGLSTSTVEGIAIAKLAEVLPIVLSILVGIWFIERDFISIYITGGNIKRSFKLGIIIAPIALIPFVVLGGFGLSVELGVLLSWIPWLFVFSFSNGFMEELMIRGLFLKKYDSLFGQKQSLLLTTVIFTVFHQAILGYTDPITFSIFLGIIFVLGLSWGYIMQKSDNIWGAVLAHAVSDILFLLVVIGV